MDSNELPCAAPGNARLTTTASESLPSTGPTFLDFATCGNAALTTFRRSISSAAASRVNPTALPESDKEAPTIATSGASSPESFANLNPDGYWLKTSQGYYQARMDGFLDVFSGTWPRAGMMRSGTAYRLLPLVPRTAAIGSSLWPTPTTSTGGPERSKAQGRGSSTGVKLITAAHLWPTPRASPNENRQRKPTPSQLAGKHGMNLATAVNLWPTPTANRWSGLQSHGHNAILGTLNPQFVEWLMGFPLDWSKIDSED